MWSSQGLTIFGRATLIKTLGLSKLIYSASNLDVPKGIVEILRTKSFKFLWKNEKDQTKRSGFYQDLDNGGIRMTDFDIMLKALKLARIPRLLRISDNNNLRLATAFDATLRSILSSVIGLQFERSKSDPSSFGTKVIIPFRCEMESSPLSCASLKLTNESFPKS